MCVGVCVHVCVWVCRCVGVWVWVRGCGCGCGCVGGCGSGVNCECKELFSSLMLVTYGTSLSLPPTVANNIWYFLPNNPPSNQKPANTHTHTHTQVSSSLSDPVLRVRHGWEVWLQTPPAQLKRVLTENDADDCVIMCNSLVNIVCGLFVFPVCQLVL